MASRMLRMGVAAGLAGGAAEVVWVAGYGAVTGTPVAAVARGVTTALLPGLANVPFIGAIGIALHMLLAVALGIAVVAAFRAPLLRRVGAWPQSALVVLALGAVWSFNFLVVLPHLDPGFLTLLPMVVTLASKLLFGVSAAAVLRTQRQPSTVSAF
jgi:predicted neutral ceramidase superfamily lipid hydrolase